LQFKQISIAYQVLSDPDLRHKYNEFGQKNGGGTAEPAGGFQDPEEVFGKMFGGDKFEDLIGTISIGEHGTAMPLMCRQGHEGRVPTAGRAAGGHDDWARRQAGLDT
jgi:DnaJ-class molecular chaperone